MIIKILNDGINQELYDKYELIIFEIIEKNYNWLDLKVNITVKVTKSNSNFDGSCKRTRKGYEVQLTDYLLKELEDGVKTDHLDIVALHELIHVKDACEVNQKNTSYKTHRRFYRTYDNFITNVGYHSWTEIHTCFNIFDLSNAYKSEPTFLEMVRKLDKIVELRDKIYKFNDDNQEYYNKILDDYFAMINEFVYQSSRYIASIPFRRTNYVHCKKTKNKEAYIYLKKLYDKVINVFVKSLHGTYGKYLLNRIYKIGLIWLEELYIPLNIYPSKLNGNVVFQFIP